MATSYEDKIKDQAQPLLDEGEHIVAAFVAQARGGTTAKMGGLAPAAIGHMKTGKQHRAGEEAGLQLTSPMALALTESRLLVLGISQPIAMGKGADVKEIVSAAPLSDVDSIEVKRLLVGKVVTVTVRGVPIKLEAGGGANAKGLAEEFARAKPAG
jgi:hypothetical protein